MSDIEESLKRIKSHNGVMGVAVLDDAGKLARFLSDLPTKALRKRIRDQSAAVSEPGNLPVSCTTAC